jgi:hypothetical protein
VVAAGAAGQDGLAAPALGVHRAERGGGEGGEHARVPADGGGDAFAPGEARADELAGVALVDLGAGGADVLAAVAARGQQHPVGFTGCVVDGAQFAGGQVDGVDAAAQPDRVGAVAGGGELLFPAAEVAAREAGGDVGGAVVGVRPRTQAGVAGPGCEGDRRGGHAGSPMCLRRSCAA